MGETMNVLITGSNRGIGKGLLSAYLSRPNHIVIAAVRDPNNASSTSLQDLPKGKDTQLLIVKIDSASASDATTAIDLLKSTHQIDKLDIVVANAGISNYFGKATVTPAEEMMQHFQVNAVGPLLLFQATEPLLRAAPKPKFVVISSGAGSISNMENLTVENTAYGSSKAAANFVARKIHFENPGLISFPVQPGWLQTDLGNHAASGAGMEQAPISVEEGVKGIVDRIDEATREKNSGSFVTFDGKPLGW